MRFLGEVEVSASTRIASQNVCLGRATETGTNVVIDEPAKTYTVALALRSTRCPTDNDGGAGAGGTTGAAGTGGTTGGAGTTGAGGTTGGAGTSGGRARRHDGRCGYDGRRAVRRARRHDGRRRDNGRGWHYGNRRPHADNLPGIRSQRSVPASVRPHWLR